jgi:hypothetical protein
MRRIWLVLAVLAAAGTSLVLGAGAALAQGEQRAINERIPFSTAVINPCNGEEVTYEGTLHIVTRVGEDRSGGLHDIAHLNFQAEGVGDQGGTYTISQVDTGTGTLTAQDANTFTVELLAEFIRRGESATPDDFTSRAVVHATRTPGAEDFTLFFEHRDVQCR